ncbi:histidine kinase dimerization/phospho-acceptor domain-containing protein [Clavibacter tessellarius]|uniref:histidine kinase dimerization/phospho-acceptor domain-containing protein n=1 Tax=Clavibacter tessellarius TaxID=31965 RepID=UPI0032434375
MSTDVTALALAVTEREEFVASVSHELKTPLTSILGYVESHRRRPRRGRPRRPDHGGPPRHRGAQRAAPPRPHRRPPHGGPAPARGEPQPRRRRRDRGERARRDPAARALQRRRAGGARVRGASSPRWTPCASARCSTTSSATP